MKDFLRYLLKTALFWLLFFTLFRLGFIFYNFRYAGEATHQSLLLSLAVGLRLDLSLTGYIILLLAVLQSFSLLLFRRFIYPYQFWMNALIVVFFTALLLGNAHLYAYWARHMDAEAFGYLRNPQFMLASLKIHEMLLYLLALMAIALAFIWFFRKWNVFPQGGYVLSFRKSLMMAGLSLLVAALMILPIRGRLGVAPINTAVAYFSRHLYANHAAINPIWNLFYSFKRLDARKHHYAFMDEQQAHDLFEQWYQDGEPAGSILNNPRPNVVIILLESFSAQVIEKLGGQNATPNFHSLIPEGIFFSQIYASSDRSDKGLVATLAGYPVLPSYSIMQYPLQAQSLPMLPQVLRQAAYTDMTYIYGGDMGFKGMNAFVNLGGFDQVIAKNDFPRSTHGQKWGVHDQYTFDRLFQEMQDASAPYFKFLFTLSSHEPFDVPMEKVFDDPYLNSVYYTDQCLGQFFTQVKAKGLWDNTLFILIADHGVPGPLRANSSMKERYHIPMLWTGGALAVSDTIITALGSQTDLAASLLNQLGISSKPFLFSKNLLDPKVREFALFTYSDAFGFITPEAFQVYDNRIKDYIRFDGHHYATDSLSGKALLQVLSSDHQSRKQGNAKGY